MLYVNQIISHTVLRMFPDIYIYFVSHERNYKLYDTLISNQNKHFNQEKDYYLC